MSHVPLYRPVLREAFQMSWHEKRLWPFALFAALLLSGSVYDVLWGMANAAAPQASLMSYIAVFWTSALGAWSNFDTTSLILGSIRVLQITALLLILGFAVAACSVVAQGVLVFVFGGEHVKSNRRPSLKEAITVGGRAFWPVFVLNILAVALLLTVRGLLAIAFVGANLASSSASAYLSYIVAFIAFAIVASAATVIQVFALNAMILQGSTLAQAILRGAEVLRRHWVIAFETALLLFAVSVAAYVLTLLVNAVLGIAFFVLLAIVSILNLAPLATAVLVLGTIVFLCVSCAILGWTVALQYAAWTILYRRLGEGGAIPKIHRWVRHLTHGYHVPGA